MTMWTVSLEIANGVWECENLEFPGTIIGQIEVQGGLLFSCCCVSYQALLQLSIYKRLEGVSHGGTGDPSSSIGGKVKSCCTVMRM